MLTLLLSGIAVVILISGFIIIINNRPDFWFWLFLNLYFDPGGYIEGYFEGKLLGPLVVKDVLIMGIIICLISVKFNWKVIFTDQFFTKFLFFLLLFVMYYFIVYGGVTPYLHNDFDYTRFLIKNRYYLYSLIILFSVYVFTIKGLKNFYLITLGIGIICLSLYFLTLLTGIEFIPIWELKREGTDMTRLILYSYGLFLMIWPLAITVFFLPQKISVNLKYRQWLYFGGLMMILTELLTLSRRIQIDIIGTATITFFILAYLFQIGTIKGVTKIAVPIILVSVVLFITLPDYAEYIKKTGEDTFLILTTGENIHGEKEYRVTGTGDLEIAKEYIENNFIFGTGYTYWNFEEGYASSTRGALYARASDAAAEVTIYYSLFGFGVVGTILMIPLYFLMGKLCLKLLKLLKLSITHYRQDSINLVLSIYVVVVIISKFTFQFWGFGGDFFITGISNAAVFFGLGFALYRNIILNLLKNDVH